VPVDWDDTRVLEAEPGDYVTIARKAKDKDEWYLGAITDEHSRTGTVPLDFLDGDGTYVATVYGDAADAHWRRIPWRTRSAVVGGEKHCAQTEACAGGGAAVSIKPAGGDDDEACVNTESKSRVKW